MDVVIDANVVKGYYQESVLGHDPQKISLTSSAVFIFDRLGTSDHAFMDDGGQVQHEWSQVVGEPEWFDPWLASLLRDQAVALIHVQTCGTLRKQLEQDCGFPVGSRDIWYVRTAAAVAARCGEAVLVSDDMDMHDPRQKQSAHSQRVKKLLSAKGPVCKLLLGESIVVRSVAGYFAMLPPQ